MGKDHPRTHGRHTGQLGDFDNQLPHDVESENTVYLPPGPSKAIIDKIDRVLAQHYGFTDEELALIINYDIKYRMGREE